MSIEGIEIKVRGRTKALSAEDSFPHLGWKKGQAHTGHQDTRSQPVLRFFNSEQASGRYPRNTHTGVRQNQSKRVNPTKLLRTSRKHPEL